MEKSVVNFTTGGLYMTLGALNAEWSFHNIILASKDQVKAQFGKDSNELHSMGIKKSSEYKKRASKKKASAVR